MTSENSPRPEPKPLARRLPALGLPLIALIGLALLAVPRVVLHDLGIVHERTFVNALLVFVPTVIWIAVALWKRVPNPFLTLIVVGLFYGVFLAAGHQVFWDVNVGDTPPTLGGNLSDLDPTAQAIIVRTFAAISSVFTGVIVGAVAGLIAWGLSKVLPPGEGS